MYMVNYGLPFLYHVPRAIYCFEKLTPFRFKAACNILVTSSPTAPAAVKPLVHSLRVPEMRLVWCTGKEKVKPMGRFSVMLCSFSNSQRAWATKSNSSSCVDCFVLSSILSFLSSCKISRSLISVCAERLTLSRG